jgi:hypothetical protein
MDVGKFLSVRDFFNYYIAGVVWLLGLALLLLWLPDPARATVLLDEFRRQIDSLGPVVGAVLAVILPYITGFTLSPVCNLATYLLRRIWGDPVQWVTDFSEGGTRKHKTRRLVKPALAQIIKHGADTFDTDVKDMNAALWFSPIRAYTIEKGGAASDHATRAYDLMNLTESLLLPIPLLRDSGCR